MKNIHDLVAFQRALELMVLVYRLTEQFPRRELYGLTSQIRRAAVGVVTQIAEGQGRLTFGEWRQFLSQARGSLYEVEAEAIAANRLAFLSDDEHARVKNDIRRTASALDGLIRWVRQQETRRTPTGQLGNPATRQPVTASSQSPRQGPPATQPRTSSKPR